MQIVENVVFEMATDLQIEFWSPKICTHTFSWDTQTKLSIQMS